MIFSAYSPKENISLFNTALSSNDSSSQDLMMKSALSSNFEYQKKYESSSSPCLPTLYDLSNYCSTSQEAFDIHYAFNVLPFSISFLQSKKNFSFLCELGRNVDICEMSSDTSSVHVFLDDLILQKSTIQNLSTIEAQEEKMASLIQKLQFSALSQTLAPAQPQKSNFHQRAKNTLNTFFASKKDKRIFALAGSLSQSTGKHSFSAHFSEKMINTLGFKSDQFMLKCSMTGFNDFFLRNDFISNMDMIIEGILASQQQGQPTQMEPIKIKQKICKSSNEAMEAVFSIYLLQGEQARNIDCNSQESVLVFEILHILDFSVQNKGKKFAAKKRLFDMNESSFLERYLKSLNCTTSSQGDAFEDSSSESSVGGLSKKKKGIQKQKQGRRKN